MLENDTIVHARTVAESIAAKNKTLVAVGGSLVSNIVNTIDAPDILNQYEISDPSYVDSNLFTQDLIDLTKDQGTADSRYTESIVTAAGEISGYLQGHIAYIKGTIKEQVLEVANKLIDFENQIRSKDPSTDYNIEQVNVTSLLFDGSIASDIQKFARPETVPPVALLQLNTICPDGVSKLLVSGSSEEDKLITVWATNYGLEEIAGIFNAYFTSASGLGIQQLAQKVGSLPVYDKLDVLLAIFILANRIYETDAKDYEGNNQPLGEIRDLAVQYRGWAASALSSLIKRVESDLKAGILVLSKDTNNKVVKVNNALYNKWITDGGKPEAILGLIVSNSNYLKISDIDEHQVELIKAWNTYTVFKKAKDNNSYISLYKSLLLDIISVEVKQLDEFSQGYVTTNPAYEETVLTRAKDFITKLTTSDIENHHNVALGLIAGCKYYYTSAYQILSDIDEACRFNPNLNEEEAALLAIINYVTDYLSIQVQLAD